MFINFCSKLIAKQPLLSQALDGSVFVRKSALCVIENILVKSGVITEDLLRVLVAHCRYRCLTGADLGFRPGGGQEF